MAASLEQRAAKKFMRDISDITFSPYFFASAVANDHPVVQARVMDVILEIIMALSSNAATMTPDNADAVMWACRFRDTMEVYSND